MRRAGAVLLLALLAFHLLAPFYWAVNTSLALPENVAKTPVDYVPSPPTLEGYRRVLGNPLFLRAVLNSALVSGGATVLSLALGAAAGCALGRYAFPGRGAVLSLFLAMTMFPQISVLGALFTLVTTTGLFNTPLALISTYLLTTLPFTVWVLSNFFRQLPRELEEAAFVDGAGPFAVFWRVLLPLAAPGLATTAILAFINTWNEYLYALSFTIDESARTAPVAIAQFTGESALEIPWNEIMAASVLVTLPLVLIVLLFQKHIVSGMTAGAVKG
ncbi:MAG: carbohydrate ABC transporter permease [Candidatus Sumerlaeia bacterium]|nr:carbohydrate ABC transporter permease [Candidatus Sumerlaeia bacterium]